MNSRTISFSCRHFVIVGTCIFGAFLSAARAQEMRELELSVLEDKIRGGWAGQMVGVAYGAPWEFRCLQRLCHEELHWSPEMIEDSFSQDDLQVEMTFAEVLDTVGLSATTEQHGEAFRNSTYPLWHANASARRKERG